MAPIAVRTRAPLVMALVVAAAFVGYGAMPGTGTPMWAFVGVLVIGFSAGANLDGRRRWAGLSALVAATYAVQLMDAARSVGELTWAEVYLTPPVIVLAPALAGRLVQRSRQQTAQVRRLAAELAAEREHHAAAAALAERNRIARELHDVISHSVSVMVVQAGAAENLLAADDPARAQVRAVRETGREALAELRRQLGLLRDDDVRRVAPMPALTDLSVLAASVSADLEVVGRLDGIGSPGLELAAYRVIQEALTNARRHADGGRARVRVERSADELAITVLDEGGGPADPGPRGAGHGLAGVRERVSLYGGTVEAGPRREGKGWRVHARLPLGGDR
jgi:signal transduction histidine kinase